MKASDVYAAAPLKVDVFDTIEVIHGTVTGVAKKHFENGAKLVLTLDDEWTLVLNAGNYRVIRADFGDETDEWIGKALEVYKGTARFDGKEIPSVCVRVAASQPTPRAAAPAKAETAPSDDIKSDIPF
jgi:hypothetical protein